MRYGYYPGCSLESISSEYDQSMRKLFKALDVEIEDLKDWICCGTVAAASLSHLIGLATPLWSVARSKKMGFDQLIAPCSACVYHFKHAVKKIEENPKLRTEIEKIIEMPLDNPPPTIHPLELLITAPFESRIKSRISPNLDLTHLKVVCYYGCHVSRPARVMQFDDPENPQSMDKIISWTGAQVMDWKCKVDCCGAHWNLIKPDVAVDLCLPIFEAALEVGADAIVVACPMCHANLDTRQQEVSEKMGRSLNLPILFFSQVIGYALGLTPKKLGLKKHLVDPLPLMLEKCTRRQAEVSR
ncbi:MAG: heterodisulfide reductase subunit B [Anaerolineales bacterium]|nr:MAG: heterodisulfide reductase subunit B [Anaerolineales bacterium]